jgi:hypothetical protein
MAHEWRKMRANPGYWPPWTTVKTAPLWSDPKYGTVAEWLCGQTGSWTVVGHHVKKNRTGELGQINLRKGDYTTCLAYGDAKSCCGSRPATDVFLVELSDQEPGVPRELVECIQACTHQKNGVRLIFWGRDDLVDMAENAPLCELTPVGSTMAAYQSRRLYVHLTEDIGPLDRPRGMKGVTKKVLLVGPGDFVAHYPYAVSLIGWHPSLLSHLLDLFKPARGLLVQNLTKPVECVGTSA